MNTLMNEPHVDITPPGADLYAVSTDAPCPVLLLNLAAHPARLLGYVHARCSELRRLSSLAACSHEDESELKRVLEHVWDGLDQVIAGLDALGRQYPTDGGSEQSSDATQKNQGVQP